MPGLYDQGVERKTNKEMRTIKFRQYYAGKFHYWGFRKEESGMSFIGSIDLLTESNQFTGLDKNGKEIYEGDIVKKICHDKYGKRSGYKRAVVEYRATPFYIGFNLGVGRTDYTGGVRTRPQEIIVIGNIYENPELLK